MNVRALLLSLFVTAPLAVQAGSVVCPASTPVQGAAVRGAEPVFPADNWWNLDIRSAPVDANSAAFISFINNGGTRRLHPDFGGEESSGSVSIYGMPYAVVDGAQVKSRVSFLYDDESDGVGQAFYPIPIQSITQPHWVEGGAPANVDQRSSSDRHLLMVDCSNNHLYELYNVWYDGSGWRAGSGAFFDMNTNNRRPNGWTSADAAGLAIFPGLVRYDEVYDLTLSEIGHAFRVTVRATNGYVWPASHRAGSTAGALPMGARLRLKASVNGADPALRTSDPNLRKIFRAMQKHGLIVADNGSDLYVTGTFDTRWDNGVLNPAFRLLSASDFDVIQLGWNPVGTAPVLSTLGITPSSVSGGSSATGSVQLSAAAPAGGAVITLASSSSAALVPSSVTVAQGASSANFTITTTSVSATTTANVTASYAGVSKTTALTVTKAAAMPALTSLVLQPRSVVGGQSATGVIGLAGPAPAGGVLVTLGSSTPAWAAVPASVTVPAGASSASFTITTVVAPRNRGVTISAKAPVGARAAGLTITRN
ncbi:hypothetical protein HLB44_02040 [Aquincola sp. S2]|uniref:Uncharacterized protein n=1 Tax=Pseudaquabacterium terrae TaxID=2732868 RepID=A0ABX2ECT0_9BURK|nr:hypothetical protein [Aquabacterium terrae]NRF65758.1 hypothetical protein [Aquabacterium terrae]